MITIYLQYLEYIYYLEYLIIRISKVSILSRISRVSTISRMSVLCRLSTISTGGMPAEAGLLQRAPAAVVPGAAVWRGVHPGTVLYCTVLYCTVLYCTVLYTQGDCARGEVLLPENFALGSRPCPATFSCHQDFHHQLDSIKNESNPLRQDELSFIQADLQVMFDNAHTTEAITWHKYTLSWNVCPQVVSNDYTN